MDKCKSRNHCSRHWEALKPSPWSPAIKSCDQCQRKVFLTATDAETALFSALGQCIAIAPDHEGMHKIGWVGESDFDWMDQAGVRATVSIDAGVRTARQLTGLHLLFEHAPFYLQILADWHAGARVCLGEYDEKEAVVLLEQLGAWDIAGTVEPFAV